MLVNLFAYLISCCPADQTIGESSICTRRQPLGISRILVCWAGVLTYSSVDSDILWWVLT